MSANRGFTSGMFKTEDWWAVWLGLGIYAASLLSLAGVDLVGWMARPRAWEWTDVTGAFAWSKLVGATAAGYAAWHPVAAWLTTYAVFAALFTFGARFQGLDAKRFLGAFTVLFCVTWAA